MIDETTNPRYDGGNRLIDGLPPADRHQIVPHLTMMTAEEASSGILRAEPITAAYFPIDAVFSVLVELARGESYEVDTVGRSGLIGGELIFGTTAASRSVICQIGGTFAQMPRDAFEECLQNSGPFSLAVHHALLLQWYRAQQTIACNFAHSLVQRCARWALLTHEAIERDTFKFRAEYLSMMLGEQTHVVMEPMATLQAVGAIRYAEDTMTIVSGRALREAACECYTAPNEYAQRLAPRRDHKREAQ